MTNDRVCYRDAVHMCRECVWSCMCRVDSSEQPVKRCMHVTSIEKIPESSTAARMCGRVNQV